MRSTRIITRKALCILLIFCVLAGFGSNWALAADVKADRLTLNQASTVDETFLKNSQEASIAYTKLLESFANHKNNVYSENFGSYRVNNIYANGFPDYYAGAYTNKEGNLVVILSKAMKGKEKEAAKKTIIELAENDYIIFTEAERSYKELVGIMSKILAFCEKDEISSTKEYGITGFAIDDYNNQVVVYMTSVTDAARKWFVTNVTDSSCIRFELNKNYDRNSSGTANCSDALWDSNRWIGSIGFRAKYTSSSGSTIYGFLTAGHCFTSNATTVTYNANDDSLGVLVTSKYAYERGDCLDVAFIRSYSGTTIYPTVETATGSTYSISTTSIITASQGTIVNMYGAASANANASIRSGPVMSSSYTSTTDDDFILTDMVKAGYISIPGDSGGIVFVPTLAGDNVSCGIHSRGNNELSYGVFCKATNITSRLNVFVY